MRAWTRPLIIIIAVFFVPLPAWSVIVKTRDGQEHKGRLIKADAAKVYIRLPGGEEKSFFKADIQNLFQPVQERELEKLKPDNPKGYYNYALVLTGWVDDPDAQDMALRLFLITAYLEPITHGYDALMKMSEIARSEEEAKAFRAMAYLLDVKADQETLKPPVKVKAEDTKVKEAFLQALSLLRRGKTKEALKAAEAKDVREYFALVPGLMTHKEFVKICKDHPECSCLNGRIFCPKCVGKGVYKSNNKLTLCTDCNAKGFTICKECDGKPRRVTLSPFQMQLILQLELQHEKDFQGKMAPSDPVKTSSWSALLSSAKTQPLPVMSLIHLTEFDPRACVFKGGKWMEP